MSLINYDPAAVAASIASGWTTLQQVLAAGKAKPHTLRVGIQSGGSAHIFAAAFARAADLDVIYVPFKGGSARAAAIAGGHIDLDFDIVAPMKPLFDAGKLRVLGVAAEKRVDLYREIPTFRENGVELVIGSFHIVFTPKGTSAEIQAKLEGAIAKTMKEPELNQQMSLANLGVAYLNQKDTARFLTQQDELYRRLIDELGMRAGTEKSR